MAQSATLETMTEFNETPQGQYAYWQEELSASRDMLKKWHKQADKIVNRYTGKHDATNSMAPKVFNLNLYHSNIKTLGDMLYGNTPKIDVSRRYADPNDDVGRVSAEIMERLLNLDIAQNGREIDVTLRSALFDRLNAGLGCARVRYEIETEQVETPFGMEERMVREDAPVEYYFWGDVLWSWARNFSEVRWIAYRNYLTKDEVRARFGDHAADNISLKKQIKSSTDESERDSDTDGPWMKAEIWEIWDKQKKNVVWFAFGYHKVLETKKDPLELAGFFPSPPFFLANPTTSLYIPTPDFTLAQDLYNEIDVLQTRISILTEAVKVVGVYDASADGVQQMFKEGMDNDLIPIDNWALFSEKGGLQGQIDWVPILDIVNALDKLRELRSEQIGLLQQVTGMSDVMRGELGNSYEGVGQSQMKAKFGSIRVQALQDQFAVFASDLMQLKADVISKHFAPETIAKRANMEFSFDKELVPQAVELIKNTSEANLRVDIRPESVAMVDYAELKSERTEYLMAIATFMQSAAPLMDADPTAKPFMLQLLQWGLAGFKGASEIEGVIDRAISASQQEAGNEKPDPAQQQMQMQMQIEQAKMQIEMQKLQAKSQADLALREADKQADIETAMAEHQMKMAEVQAGMQASLMETQAKMEADVLKEQAQAKYNIMQSVHAANAEMQKDSVNYELDMQKEVAKTNLKIQEMAVSTSQKIKEAKAKPTVTKGETGE